ncbi:MAG: hypothetical protein PF638_13490, partial [Candidatus Delongbacteria bacterium]|nr:hypothetical protein [Candidatus Delongbacteria bacterium]
MKKIELTEIFYQNENKFKLNFKYNTFIVNSIKKIPGRIWDNELKCWIIPKNENIKEELQNIFKNKA